MSESGTSRLPIWLIVSLMANALLIGLIIGGGIGQRRGGAAVSIPGNEQALVRGIERSLPDEQRTEVRRAFRRAFADTRPQRLRLRAARQNLGPLLSAEDYDPVAVQEAFGELRAADDAMKARMHDVLAEQFGALTPEQRQAIIRDFNRRGERRNGRDGERSQRNFQGRN